MKASVKLIFLLGSMALSLFLMSFHVKTLRFDVKTAIFGDKKPVTAAAFELRF